MVKVSLSYFSFVIYTLEQKSGLPEDNQDAKIFSYVRTNIYIISSIIDIVVFHLRRETGHTSWNCFSALKSSKIFQSCTGSIPVVHISFQTLHESTKLSIAHRFDHTMTMFENQTHVFNAVCFYHCRQKLVILTPNTSHWLLIWLTQTSRRSEVSIDPIGIIVWMTDTFSMTCGIISKITTSPNTSILYLRISMKYTDWLCGTGCCRFHRTSFFPGDIPGLYGFRITIRADAVAVDGTSSRSWYRKNKKL